MRKTDKYLGEIKSYMDAGYKNESTKDPIFYNDTMMSDVFSQHKLEMKTLYEVIEQEEEEVLLQKVFNFCSI